MYFKYSSLGLTLRTEPPLLQGCKAGVGKGNAQMGATPEAARAAGAKDKANGIQFRPWRYKRAELQKAYEEGYYGREAS